MKIYIDGKDKRFYYLREWLSNRYEITDDIAKSDCIILDIAETNCPNNIKNNCLIISFQPIDYKNSICINQSENFLIKNAYLTALACIHKLDHDYNRIVIYGNGRIATFLKQFMQHATILARHPKDGENYIDSKEYMYADLIINTVPALVPIDVNLLRNDVKIIDLASFPYGFDHNKLKVMNIDIEIWGSLPGKVFPKEAGWLIYEEVIKCLEV